MRSAVLPFRHHAVEERLLHRAVRLGHRQQERHRLPGAGGVHVGDEAGQFAQHARRGGARVGQHRVAAQQRAAGEVRLRRDRGEAVALDGEAQQGDARTAHSVTPSSFGDPRRRLQAAAGQHQHRGLLRRDRAGGEQLAERRRHLGRGRLDIDADRARDRASRRRSPPRSASPRRRASRAACRAPRRSRIGCAIAVPSAMVGLISVATGTSLPARNAAAIGPQFAGWAAKMRGIASISPARSNSEKPISQPSTFDPAPHGVMMLSGARKPRSSHSS